MYSLLTTQSLEITLAGAVVANQVQVTGSYVEITIATGAVTAVTAISAQSNGASTVTIVAAPAGGTVRIVKEMTFYNADTANVTLNVTFNDNGTLRQMIKAVIPTLYTVSYNDNAGWK